MKLTPFNVGVSVVKQDSTKIINETIKNNLVNYVVLSHLVEWVGRDGHCRYHH